VTGLAGVDRAAVEAQGGDEASLGMVGFEHLDVGGVVDAVGGHGGDPVAVLDDAHVTSRPVDTRFAPRRPRRARRPRSMGTTGARVVPRTTAAQPSRVGGRGGPPSHRHVERHGHLD
jgi:hypothetical protein